MNPLWLFAMIVADGVMPLVPGEAALLATASGAFAAGWPAVLGLAVLAATAALLGDTITYLLGRRLGSTRFAWQRHPRVADLLARTGDTLDRKGLPLIVSARLLPGWRVAIAFMAGATGMPRRRFVAASALGSSVWAAYLLVVGTTVGAVTGGNAIVVAVASLVIMALLAVVARRVRRALTGSASGTPRSRSIGLTRARRASGPRWAVRLAGAPAC